MQCNVAWGENQINDKGTYADARNNAMACAARRRVAPCSHNALYQRTTSTKSIVSCARVLVHITHRQKKNTNQQTVYSIRIYLGDVNILHLFIFDLELN